MIIGKQTGGKVILIPRMFLFAGIFFINAWGYSFMFPLPASLVQFLSFCNYDVYGDRKRK